MTLFVELTKPRRDRIETELGLSALSRIREFLGAFATRNGWDTAMTDRLDAAGEETLVTLIRQHEAREERPKRRLSLVAYREGDGAVLEFVAAYGEDNIQDQLSMLGDQADVALAEREVSLRLLRHFADSVSHRQYHGKDIVTVQVKAPQPARGPKV